jgi:hypothetical protein
MAAFGALGKKEVPFLVTLLVGIAGWAITHAVTRTLSAPTLEYHVVSTPAPNQTTTTIVKVTNLSDDAFFGLTFEIQGSGAQPCADPISSTPPAMPSTKPPKAANDAVSFTIDQLQPGWDISMCARLKGRTKPVFVLTSIEKHTVRLVEPSVRTWLVRNEFALTAGLFFVAFAVFIAWLFLSSGEARKERRP